MFREVLARLVSASALVDRFAQHCHVLDIDAESWRNKEALKRGKPKKPKPDT